MRFYFFYIYYYTYIANGTRHSAVMQAIYRNYY